MSTDGVISTQSNPIFARVPRDTWALLFGLLLYRLSLVLFILVSRTLLPHMYGNDRYQKNHIYEMPMSNNRWFEWAVMPWDAGHYIYLSEHGYSHAASFHNAFYPLWPFLIAVFSHLTAGNHIVAGVVLANVISIFAVLVVYQFVREKWNQETAGRTIVLLLAFPGAIFLALPYTEPIFLLLSAIAFRQLGRDQFWKAGLAAYFAALSRPTGVLWAVPILVDVVKKKRYDQIWCALLPFAGLLTMMLIVYLKAGNPFATFIAQSHFVAKTSVRDLLNLKNLISEFTMHLQLHGFLDSAIDRVWFVLTIPLLIMLYRGDKTVFAYTFLMVYVPAMAVKMMAFTRYALVAFPLFIVVAQRSLRTRSEWWFYAVVAFLYGMQILFLLRQINFAWVG